MENKHTQVNRIRHWFFAITLEFRHFQASLPIGDVISPTTLVNTVWTIGPDCHGLAYNYISYQKRSRVVGADDDMVGMTPWVVILHPFKVNFRKAEEPQA